MPILLVVIFLMGCGTIDRTIDSFKKTSDEATHRLQEIAPVISNVAVASTMAVQEAKELHETVVGLKTLVTNLNHTVDVTRNGMEVFLLTGQKLSGLVDTSMAVVANANLVVGNVNLMVLETRTNLNNLAGVVTKTVVSYRIPNEVWVGIGALVAALVALIKSSVTAGKKAKMFDVLAAAIDKADLDKDTIYRLKDAQKEVDLRWQHEINKHLDAMRGKLGKKKGVFS